MITSSISIKHHEELILDRDHLCTQVDAGNPFFDNQDFIFSSKGKKESDLSDLCKVESFSNELEGAVDFVQGELTFSLNRARRLPENPAVINAVGLDYLRIGNTGKAVEAFQNALAIDKEYFPAMANLAKCHSIIGDLDSALAIFKDVEPKKPDDLRVFLNIALLYFRKKDFNSALSYLIKAKKIDPDNPSVLNNIGLVYLERRNLKEAISSIRKACRLTNNDPLIYSNLGVCFAVQNNFRKAIINFEIAHSLFKDDKGILLNLSNAYNAIEEYKKVVDLLEEYLRYHPGELELRNVIAWSYLKLGLYDKSLKELKIALRNAKIEDKTGMAGLLNNMAVIYKYRGFKSEAKKLLLSGLELNPNAQFIHYNLIDIYFKSGDLETMKKQIDHALSIYTEDPILLSYLGDYYSYNEEYETAKNIYLKVLELDPNALVPYIQLSSIELNIYDNINKALEISKMGLKKHSQNIGLFNNHAYALILAGRLIEARNFLDKIEVEDNPQLTATRGLLLIKEGDVNEGRRYYNRAILLAANDKELAGLANQKKHLELGKYYLTKGNKKEAIRLLRKGLRIETKQRYYKNRIAQLVENIENESA